ncbi:hypothetical protein [Prosthecobacter sp.]|uniref:hypothetical protein n=1 Tax=Prosthecobacter sp. TaxID=1965333 RepID=UPI002ABB3BC7|nr:hypothetical protein [Prosthecobacter sp.]MDZ4401811.1 hypothetical protein [Prosthecobacter sp.]
MKCASFVILLFATGCVSSSKQKSATDATPLIPGDPFAPSQVTPDEAMAIAQSYTNHSWRPFARNILHGKDKAGILVNTPDASHEPEHERRGWWIPGEANHGVPYKWGGFDDPAAFDLAISNGSAGGDVSSPEKRRADNAAVSERAAGVDCSGFVSRCLKLPSVHDTTQLPAVCTELPSASDLRPGDVLNIPRRHVILCGGWATPDHSWIYYYETGGAPDYWKPGLKQAPLDALLALGYKPLRYKGMAYEPVPSGKQPREVLTRAVKTTAAVVANPTIGEP